MVDEMCVIRGTTNSFGVTVTDEEGNDYTLEADQVLVFGLKRNKLDDNRVLVKKINRRNSGEHYLEISPEDTKNLEPGMYYYDIGMQQGQSIFYNIVEASPFVIKPNVTKLGDGS